MMMSSIESGDSVLELCEGGSVCRVVRPAVLQQLVHILGQRRSLWEPPGGHFIEFHQLWEGEGVWLTPPTIL